METATIFEKHSNCRTRSRTKTEYGTETNCNKNEQDTNKKLNNKDWNKNWKTIIVLMLSRFVIGSKIHYQNHITESLIS